LDRQTNKTSIYLKSYADNCLVLCSVMDVLHDELVVSLPGINNIGYIKSTNISREYTNHLCESTNANAKTTVAATTLPYLYSIGTMLRCKVIEYRNKRLYLTCEPNELNSGFKLADLYDKMIISGSVKSKEDHGYIVDLGWFFSLIGHKIWSLKIIYSFLSGLVEDSNCFYKCDTTVTQLPIGKCCNFKINKIKDKRFVDLSLSPNADSTLLANKNNFNLYLPGTKLNQLSIEKISRNGVKVRIGSLANLTAYIHMNHMPNRFKKVLYKMYKNGDKLSSAATIVYVNPYSKVLYMSLLKYEKIENLIDVGGIFTDLTVIKHSFKGLYVEFSSSKPFVCD
jgi:hypothetical protein